MTKISPHLWYTEAATFYASKAEPGKHIGRINIRARIDHRGRNPRAEVAATSDSNTTKTDQMLP